MAWWIPLAMMGAGAAKGSLDQKQAARDRKAEAEIARWSPWTGMSPQRVSDGGGVLGGMMQGGVSGLGLMQAMGASGGGKAPAGNISDTTPGYAPSAPASTAGGEAMMSSAPQAQQGGYNLYGQSQTPPGYEWMGMQRQSPYSIYGGQPAPQQPMMIVQK